MAINHVGIRREDKNDFERRAPLTPEDVHFLSTSEGVPFVVQSSPIRVFADREFEGEGVRVSPDLSGCRVVLGIREIPVECIQADHVYAFFSHTIKGQPHNLPMLAHILEVGATLIDYERIVDDHGRRLIGTGEHAGLAGMLDTLWALGQRWQLEGRDNVFSCLRQALAYDSLEAAEAEVAEVGRRIESEGLPLEVSPLVVGICGYGTVSRGVQKLLARLPVTEIAPAQLAALFERSPERSKTVYKVVFHEEHTMEPADGVFSLVGYMMRPEEYHSCFPSYLKYLTVLVNSIFWDTRYPRLVSNESLRELYGGPEVPRLKVIGDISCDIGGAIECTVKTTTPDRPTFTFDPLTGDVVDGLAGRGPVILAVDNLPCEVPRDASRAFSHILKRFVPDMAQADFSAEFEDLDLTPEIKNAVIAHRGRLTPSYTYLAESLRRRPRVGC